MPLFVPPRFFAAIEPGLASSQLNPSFYQALIGDADELLICLNPMLSLLFVRNTEPNVPATFAHHRALLETRLFRDRGAAVLIAEHIQCAGNLFEGFGGCERSDRVC